MQVARITERSELQQLRSQWNSLTRGVPFRDWQWLHTWWRHYDQNRTLYVLAVRDAAGTLVGLAPWYAEWRPATGRVIRFLGDGKVSTDHQTLLVAQGQEGTVVDALAEWLLEHAHAHQADCRWDLLRLEGVSDQDETTRELVAKLRAGGCSANTRIVMNGWRLRLPSSWSQFAGELGRSTRKNVKAYLRKLGRNSDMSVVRVGEADQLQAGLRTLIELHQRRRRSLGDPGCFSSPSFTSFIQEMAELMLQAGKLQFSTLLVQGVPAACELNLVEGGTTYFYQGGLEPELLRHSPGNLLMTVLLQQALEAGQGCYDFLRGDEQYKSRWGARPYPIHEIRVAANRLAPQVRHGAWLAVTRAKPWVKKGAQLITSFGDWQARSVRSSDFGTRG